MDDKQKLDYIVAGIKSRFRDFDVTTKPDCFMGRMNIYVVKSVPIPYRMMLADHDDIVKFIDEEFPRAAKRDADLLKAAPTPKDRIVRTIRVKHPSFTSTLPIYGRLKR